MRPRWLVIAVILLLTVAYAEADEIVITEIMYAPASDSRWPTRTQWVEIYNRSDRTIELDGWHLANENGRTNPIRPADGADGPVRIAPAEAVVLIPGNQSVADFRAAWGDGFAVIPLPGWHKPGMKQLTDEPSRETGVLTLRRPAGDVADKVNYDDEGRWPPAKPHGPSIYLLPHAIDTTSNNDGANWARSELRRHGARHARPEGGYDPQDVGSPGVVVID